MAEHCRIRRSRLREGSPRRRRGGARERVVRSELRPRALPRPLPARPDPSASRSRIPRKQARAAPFIDKLRAFLERVDSDMIDRTGEIPEEYVQELREMGAFGIKIPTEYGGLGLSYASYARAMAMVTSQGRLAHRAALGASVDRACRSRSSCSAPTEQKQRFFPRLAKGAISAFALTEVDAGSDPANMRTQRDAERRTASTSSSTARSSGAPTARAPSCSS